MSHENLVDDADLLDAGQFLFEAVVFEEQFFAVQAQSVQDGGVPVVDADSILGSVPADLVGVPVGGAAFDTRSREPD